MSKIHGKVTYFSLNAVDLSAYSNNSDFERMSDSHDVTTFGKNSHVYSGGLLDGTIKVEGIYESISVTGGPRPTIRPLIGTVVPFELRSEGTGSTKPKETGNVLVTKYTESAPVADMVKWSVELQMSDDVTAGTQT